MPVLPVGWTLLPPRAGLVRPPICYTNDSGIVCGQSRIASRKAELAGRRTLPPLAAGGARIGRRLGGCGRGVPLRAAPGGVGWGPVAG